MNRCSAGTIGVLALLAVRPLGGQAPTGFAVAAQAIEALTREDHVVGAALAYVERGRVLVHREFGEQDRARHLAMGADAIFHWASITKTLTAVAVLQLRDHGRLSLDDPITRWVPELRQVHDPFGSMDAITLRMLLSHSSGLQNPTWPYRHYLNWEPFEPTRWEQLVAMMPYQELVFAPGSRYGYSNPAFIYLARVIEAVTGDPYQSYIAKNIWSPLGMRRSYFGATPYHLASWRSDNYTVRADSLGAESVRDNGADFDPGITIPNGGWNAPIGDLAIWLGFIAGAPPGDSATTRVYQGVLSRASVEEMWRPVVPVGEGPGGAATVGLGFFLLGDGPGRLVFHTGEQAGFRSFFYLDPARGTGIIGVVNTVNEAQPDSSARWFDEARAAAVAVWRGQGPKADAGRR
jgi:CubicO group peptidase (beta-lactamase class C family)